MTSTEILLKVALDTIAPNLPLLYGNVICVVYIILQNVATKPMNLILIT
jgi:hypothetical protein